MIFFSSLCSIESRNPNIAMDIAVSDNYAYILDFNYGLHIVNIQDKSNPVYTGFWHKKTTFNQIIYEDGFVYILADNQFVYIIDVSNPEDPILTSSYDSRSRTSLEIILSNNLLFIRQQFSYQIIDVNNNKYPIKIHEQECDVIMDFCVEGDLFFVLTGIYQLYIFNISSPISPTVETYLDFNYNRLLQIENNHLFIANWSTISIFDITSTSNITQICSLNTTNFEDFEVYDDYIFTYFHTNFSIIDISNILNPISIINYNTDKIVKNIHLEGDYLFVAADSSITILDFYNPYSIVELSEYSLWFPRTKTTMIIVVSIVCVVLLLSIGLGIWQRKKVKNAFIMFSTWLKKTNKISLSLIVSIVFFVIFLLLLILFPLVIGGFNVLFFTIEPLLLSISFLVPLITIIVMRSKKEEALDTFQKDMIKIEIASAVFVNFIYFLLWGSGIFFGGAYLLDKPIGVLAGLMALFYALGSFLFGLLIAFTSPKKAVLPISISFSVLTCIFLVFITILGFYYAEKIWAQILMIIGVIGTCITIVITAILFSRYRYKNKNHEKIKESIDIKQNEI